jgi:hypothetical protein
MFRISSWMLSSTLSCAISRVGVLPEKSLILGEIQRM